MSRLSPENICGHTFLPVLGEASIVFDFGGNRGAFCHAIIEKFGCRVFAAEPVPSLQRAIAPHPKLDVLPVAIAGANGTLRINVYDERCATMFGDIAAGERSDTVEVEAVSLPEFQERTGAQHIDLLKVDIEGAEFDLFENTPAAVLSDIDQITVEFHDFLYPQMHARAEAAKLKLKSLGFSMISFSRDNTDVLFLNRRLGVSVHERAWLYGVKYRRGVGRLLKRRFAGHSQ